MARRREIEAHLHYEGDEMDLLGIYLDNGFNIGDVEYKREVALNIMMKSKELDPYIVGVHEGQAVTKPELAMTTLWKDLLNTITNKKTPGWIEACFVLLNTTKEDQEKFEKALRELMTLVIKGKTEKPHNWVAFFSGPERRRYAIIGYPYITSDKELRNDIMAQALDEDEVKKSRGALVIGIDLKHGDWPYTVLARRMSTDLFDTLTLEDTNDD